MPSIVVSSFLGENRAAEPKLIPEGQGVLSLNQKPGRGDLRPWREPAQVFSAPTGTQTIYRMGRDTPSDTLYWLAWPGVVHAVMGFDIEDVSERTVYSGDGYPKVTNNLALSPANPTVNPVGHRPLGLPAPASAVTVTVDAAPPDPDATALAETDSYFYVYTYVNDWGWESAPSPVSAEVVRTVEDTAQVTGFAAPPGGGYGINRVRVYRTQAGSSGDADFFFVEELALPAGVLADSKEELGEVLPTKTWITAPGVPRGGGDNHTEEPLRCLTPMWNGMLAGITGKSVRFCEAYTPYAWPIAYDVVPADAVPVGLGVYGQNLLVLTTGNPVLVSGSSPDALDQAPLEVPQGCIAPRSIVSMGAGVAWASNDGLCWVGAGGARVLTAGLLLREDWLALRPQTIRGQMYEGLYFGSYEPAPDGPRRGFLVDPSGGAGIFFLEDGFDAAHFDKLQDQLYLLRGTRIVKWEAGAALMRATFRSKVYRQPRPVNFSVAEVVASEYPVTLTVWADGEQVHEEIVEGRDPFRLPAGFMASDWQVQVSVSRGGVQAVALATSTQEIAGI